MTKINTPIQKQDIVIIKKMKHEWVFPSTSSDKSWTVKYYSPNINRKNRKLSCDCPAAIYKHSEDRICKHIQYLLDRGVPLYEI